MTSYSFSKFQQSSPAVMYLCLGLIIILPIVIICFRSIMSRVPANYIILFSFTLAESYLVSFVCSVSDPSLVLMAALMTLAMVASLTFYAYTTKTDFTIQGGMLFVIGAALMMLVIFGFFTRNNIFHILICVVAIILFGLYILYDTQLILGNKQVSLEIDDYIYASFMLYTDIIILFLRILELLSRINGNR
mmetsp:Transcript_27667/g.28805  ORF Transcript_27667/g.28805 Transcript_27667/m.28805 type:complete len:191 (-) Transcript_27667:148-720(-)